MNWLATGILLTAVVVGGCASHHELAASCPEQAHHAPHHHQHLACGSVPPRPASGLIFDRQPGPYTADQFAYRSDWPSTLGYFRAPELIFYRENFIDRQGPGVPFQDHTYRRFQTVRQGAGIR